MFKIPTSRTKIVATMGPSTSPKATLKKMIESGIDVCRLNFSHGSHEDHRHSITTIRELNKELEANVAILADLQGPKLRVGEIKNGQTILEKGQTICFVTYPCESDNNKFYISYQAFAKDVKKGDAILVDDGKIKLEVIDTNKSDMVTAKIINGGVLSSRKGVNLPDTAISMPSLTPKDKADAAFALENDVDWLALSFVRSVNDIIELKKLIRKQKKNARIVAKIEKPEALKEIDEIIDASNAIMVARGDLGVETPFDRVPLIQKEIVNKCINLSKPVIIATQMMENMISNLYPTRAEANDVANAVIDGADALMLSGETSVGQYPIETVSNMQKIISYTESKGFHFNRQHPPKEFNRTFLPDSICYNACNMSEQADAKAIIVFTHSGYTAFRIASQRPRANVFAFTKNKALLTKLSLLWSVRAFYFEKEDNIDEAINYSIAFLKARGLVADDDVLVHVGSTPIYKRGQTNMIKISYV